MKTTMKTRCSASRFVTNDWYLSVEFDQTTIDEIEDATPVTIHFVIGNKLDVHGLRHKSSPRYRQ